MAHNIEFVNGVAQMAYAGQTPWHGLGFKVHEDISSLEMMNTAGLNWTVSKAPVFAHHNGQVIETDKSALIRDTDNTVLDVVGDDWLPVQNHDAFDFFTDFVAEGNMKMHTAGSLDSGRIVWALAEVKESFELFGGDRVDSYLLFVNPHKYARSIDIRFTPIRVVCQNTLSMALHDNTRNGLKINHRSTFNADLVKQTLGIAHNKLDNYKDAAVLLGSKRYTKESFSNYLKDVFGVTKDGELTRTGLEVQHVIDLQPGTEFAPGSWWQAFNSVTFATDHMLGRSDDSRLRSAWFGLNKTKKDVALVKALEYATVA
jgi:phage/plasmid-like protein (TIGR03299 family)